MKRRLLNLSAGPALALALAATISGGCGDDADPADDDTSIADTTGDSDTSEGDTSSDGDTTSTPDTTVPDDTTDPNAPDKLTATIGPFNVQSGVEQTMCAIVSLGNVDPASVTAIRVNLTAGSHHLIAHRLDDPPSPAEPCSAFENGQNSDVLFIAQQADTELVYPVGSGLPIKANQSIGIEMHFINYFAEDAVDITGTVEFDVAEPDAELIPVQVMFLGPFGFSLPPGQETVVEDFFPMPVDREFFALTSHTHELGVRATIERATSLNDPDAVMLHESLSWSEPPLDLFEPMFRLEPGEGFRLECTFDNTRNETVGFGTSFLDEMCFMWGYYLETQPETSLDRCASDADIAAVAAAGPTLTQTLGNCVVNCFQSSDSACQTDCVADGLGTSPGCSACFDASLTCIIEKCAGECISGPGSAACNTCAADSCGPAFESCGGTPWPVQ